MRDGDFAFLHCPVCVFITIIMITIFRERRRSSYLCAMYLMSWATVLFSFVSFFLWLPFFKCFDRECFFLEFENETCRPRATVYKKYIV